MRSRIAILLGMAGLSLGACATTGAYGQPLLGYGYGYGDPYSFGYCDPYDSLSSCGWYGDTFYPGSGLYSYDRGHNRHVWDGGGGRQRTAGLGPQFTPGSSGGVRFGMPHGGGGRGGFGGGRRG
jgi:hypothetical protein